MTVTRYIAKYGTYGTELVGRQVCDRLLLGEGANEHNKALAREFRAMLTELTQALTEAST